MRGGTRIDQNAVYILARGHWGAMINPCHTHLMASDPDATIVFWRDHFGVETDDRAGLVARLEAAGVSVTDVRVPADLAGSGCFAAIKLP